MSDGQIVIDTRLNSDGVSNGVRRIQSEAQKAGKAFDSAGEVAEREWGQSMRETTEETTESVSSIKDKVESLSDGFNKLAKAIGLAFVVDKIKDVSKAVVETGINYNALKEQSLAAWSTILGSDQAAKTMFDRIVSFSATTPFTQMGVDEMAKQLTNAGFKGQDLFNQLTKFGDMGSAFGIQEDSLKEMVRQYSQVQMAGVAYTEDLNILQDRGVPIFKALSEVMGVHVSDVKKLASQGKITADVYNKAINKIASSTKGAMEKQSLTFNGLVSTLKDNMSILAGELAKPIFDKLKSQLSTFLPAFQNFVDVVGKKGLAQALSETFPKFAPLIKVITDLGHILTNTVLPIIKDFFTFIGEHAQILLSVAGIIGTLVLAFKAFTIIQTIISIVEGLGVVFGILEAATVTEAGAQMALNLAFLACPLFWIVAAVMAVVGVFIYLWNTSEGFRNFWIGLWNGIKSIVGTCVNAIIGFFKKVINFIKNDWKQILLFLVNPIAGAFALLYKHCDGFKKFVDNFIKAVINFFKQLPANIKKIFDLVWNTIKKWGDNVWKFFNQTIPKWIMAIGKWFLEIPQKIGFALGFVLGTLAKWGMNVWKFFTTTIPKWISFVGQWFAKLPGLIWKWLISTIQKIDTWRIQMIQKAIQAGKEFLSNIINWFKQLPGRIWEWLVNTYRKVDAWKNQLIQKAVEAASNFIKNFLNWIAQLPGRFMNWLSQALHNVFAWGGNLARAGLNAGKQLVDSIVNTIKNIPHYMLEIGKNIVEGIWNGIVNAKNWIVDKVKGFASSVVGGFKSAFGIHSPSRVMASEIGAWIPPGINTGIEQSMPTLNSNIKDQMSNMTNKMKATVQAQTSGLNFKSNFTSGLTQSFKLVGSNEKNDTNLNPTMITKFYIDGEEVSGRVTHKVIENITENQNNYAIATGGRY